MAANWTDEQLQAIEAGDSAIIVSAAAGSGKTTVLVERILRMLSSRNPEIPADRMIVVTFTNDAAAEMKQRLTRALSELIEEQPDNAWLSRQQTLLQTAKISTIHSFCFDLIRENLQSLNVSAGFRIMDDVEESLLLQSAVRKAMEDGYKSAPEIMDTLLNFFCVKGDALLENQLLSMYKFLVSIPYYWDWIERQALMCADIRVDWKEEYLRYLSGKFERFAHLAALCHNKAAELEAPKAEALFFEEAHAFAGIAEALASDISWDEKIIRAKGMVFDRINYGIPKDDYERKNAAEELTKIRNDYKKDYKKLFDEELFTEAEIREDLKLHEEILSGMIFLLKNAEEEITKKKKEKNALCFSDAEQLAVALLSERTPDGKITRSNLAKELSNYYHAIMIDEFQDANTTQDMIFKLLSHNGSAEENGDNLFLVGDVKQSIYRFRLANPGIFVKTLEGSRPYEEKTAHSAILLNRNFRSCEETVDFVNFIFGGIMSKEFGDIDYGENEKLIAGAKYPPKDRTPEILTVSVPEEQESDNDDSEHSEYTVIELEAEAVAQKINNMISSGVTVTDHGAERPCKSRDFCILLRNKASGAPFVAALSKYGIKAHTDEVDGYLKSREISVLLSFLQVIDNPLNDVPMTAVLLSPMFSFTAEEMALLRLLDKKAPIYKLLLLGEHDNSLPETLKNKVLYFLEAIRELRRLAAVYPPQKLIRTIYDKTDFLSVVQLYTDGEKKKANLRLLLEYARTYEESSDGGLSGFVRYIRNISNQGGDLKQAGTASQADDVVSVKTIHKSKGLEFPFVFLCRTSHKFNLRDLSAQVQRSQELGIGFKIQDGNSLKKYPSLPFVAIRENSRRNSLSEEMRLLYVALTRAKEGLFIMADINDAIVKKLCRFASRISYDEGRVTPALALEANCFEDWILMMTLLHPDGGYFRNLSDVSINPIGTNSRVKIYTPELEKSSAFSESAERICAKPDAALVTKLKKQFSYVYPENYGNLPAKLTVSELSHPDSEEILLSRPKFLQDKGFTGAERGTATHTFMQYASFSLAEENVKKEVDRLVSLGHLTPRQGEAVLNSALERFFDSELYERLKRADKIDREKKFLISFDDLGIEDELTEKYKGTDGMLQGISDCVFIEDGELVLLDYKTDRVNSGEELANRYRRQLELYRAAMEKLYGMPVKEGLLYSFSLGETVKVL